MLRLIALGHTTPEIAGLLDISTRTVESHRHHILVKLDLGRAPISSATRSSAV